MDDVGKSLKNLVFTMTWLEKINSAKAPEYEVDLVSNLIDIIDNTESRTQLAVFVKGLNEVLKQKEILYDQNQFKNDINMRSKQLIDLNP